MEKNLKQAKSMVGAICKKEVVMLQWEQLISSLNADEITSSAELKELLSGYSFLPQELVDALEKKGIPKRWVAQILADSNKFGVLLVSDGFLYKDFIEEGLYLEEIYSNAICLDEFHTHCYKDVQAGHNALMMLAKKQPKFYDQKESIE